MKKIQFCALFLAVSLTLFSCGEESFSSGSISTPNSSLTSETSSSLNDSTGEEIVPTYIESDEELEAKYNEMEAFKANAYKDTKFPAKYTYVANMEESDEKVSEIISMDLENLRANHIIEVGVATWDGSFIEQSLEYYVSYDESRSVLKSDLISEYNNLYSYDEVSMTKKEARDYFISARNSPMASYHDTSYLKLIDNPYESSYGIFMMKSNGGPFVADENIEIKSYENIISTYGEGSLNIDASYVATEELREDATIVQVPERTVDYNLVIKDGYVSLFDYENTSLIHDLDGTEYRTSRTESKKITYEYKNFSLLRSSTATKNNLLYGYDNFYNLVKPFLEMANY